MKKRNVAIFLFDDVEVLDFAGPFEVFAVTSELNHYEPFNVYTVAAEKAPVRAVNGLSVNPDYSVADCPAPDLLIIPGGVGSRQVIKSNELVAWVKDTEGRELTLSVCTGSLVLAKAGLLAGRRATTHHEVYDFLGELAPDAVVDRDSRFVDEGDVITSGGISAGIDMSLYVVEKLLGKEVCDRTRVYMEYGNWRNL